jgi:hypothetical protein
MMKWSKKKIKRPSLSLSELAWKTCNPSNKDQVGTSKPMVQVMRHNHFKKKTMSNNEIKKKVKKVDVN